ncbi:MULTISPECIES: GNAT family N-acetyltransferase [unclassified Variovorax]|uniref:GNAT family N-acetyltransferase n=1 Tax=unclassified Variovorax TaxID=663243 RepID=UPI001BD1F53A|nr:MULTISPECIES: GNAT family N-acetyltransferase [unclassified Variovorax]
MTPARTIDTRFLDIHNASPAEWAAYHRYRRLRASQDTPDEPVLADADFELAVRKRSPLIESRRYVALIDGEVVGNLFIGARRNGSPDYETFAPFLDAGGGVLHEHRRQGVATALLRPLLDFMEAHGKHTATASADLPAGHAFLSALGATEKLRMIENRLPLAGLDWAELARWKAGVDAPALGLRWRFTRAGCRWTGLPN